MTQTVLQDLLQALYIGTGFLWTAAWAIFLGLMITSWVQVYVSKEKLAKYMGTKSLSDLSWSSFFGRSAVGAVSEPPSSGRASSRRVRIP